MEELSTCSFTSCLFNPPSSSTGKTGIDYFQSFNDNTNKKQTLTIPWVPKIGPKIKKEIQKFGFRVAFQTGPNLKNILCKNKDKLIPNS